MKAELLRTIFISSLIFYSQKNFQIYSKSRNKEPTIINYCLSNFLATGHTFMTNQNLPGILSWRLVIHSLSGFCDVGQNIQVNYN